MGWKGGVEVVVVVDTGRFDGGMVSGKGLGCLGLVILIFILCVWLYGMQQGLSISLVE